MSVIAPRECLAPTALSPRAVGARRAWGVEVTWNVGVTGTARLRERRLGVFPRRRLLLREGFAYLAGAPQAFVRREARSSRSPRIGGAAGRRAERCSRA